MGLIVAVAVLAPLEVSAQDSGQDPAQRVFRPLTQAMLNDPDPADWVMWRGGYANWGYSPLDQITADNVNELRLAWSWAFAPAGPGSTGMQVEPIVYDGVMYIRHANERYSAHDATTGDVIWEYSRPVPEEVVAEESVLPVHRGRGGVLF